MPASATDCGCVDIVIPEPSVKPEKIWTTTEVELESSTAINLNKGQAVTFREWAGADPAAPFNFKLDSTQELKCIEVLGEPYKGTYYQ